MSDEASAKVLSPKKKKAFKDYSKIVRVFDKEDGYRLRSDALCFKDECKREILMVSSRNTPDEWTIPGGGLDPGEQPGETAVREAMEEAGVQAEVLEFVGVYDNDARKTRTNVYSLIVRGDSPNWKDNDEIQRRRQWIDTKAAIAGLEKRDRHIKSKYLKDAYELPVKSVGSGVKVMSSNGRRECNGLQVGSDEDPT